ncbi:hypothetical protein ACIGAN_17670 [Streptomyces sp. NPDC085931]
MGDAGGPPTLRHRGRVPGALMPVRCEAERGHAVYAEPDVWVPHSL